MRCLSTKTVLHGFAIGSGPAGTHREWAIPSGPDPSKIRTFPLIAYVKIFAVDSARKMFASDHMVGSSAVGLFVAPAASS